MSADTAAQGGPEIEAGGIASERRLSGAQAAPCAFNSSHWSAVEETVEALCVGREISLIVGAKETGLVALPQEIAAALPRRFSPVFVEAGSSSIVEAASAALGAERSAQDDDALAALERRIEQLAEFDAAVALFVLGAERLGAEEIAALERLAAHGRQLGDRGADAPTTLSDAMAPPRQSIAAGSAILGAKMVLLGRHPVVAALSHRPEAVSREAAASAALLRDFRSDEVRAYLRRLLTSAPAPGEAPAQGDEPITAEAVRRVAEATGGRPVRLGALCAHPRIAEALGVVDLAAVDGAIADLGFEAVADAFSGEAEETASLPEVVRVTRNDEGIDDAEWRALEQITLEAGLSRRVRPKRLKGARARLVISDRLRRLSQRVAAKDFRRGARRQAEARHRRAAATAQAASPRPFWLTPALAIAATAACVSVTSLMLPGLVPGDAPRMEPAPSIVAEAAPEAASVPGPSALTGIVDGALATAESAARSVAGGSPDSIAGGLAEDVAESREALRRARALEGIAALPEAERASALKRRVEGALALVEGRMAAGRLTRPEGDSAYDALLLAYRLAPQDPRVVAGLQRLEAAYKAKADNALRQERFQEFHQFNQLIDAIRLRRPI